MKDLIKSKKLTYSQKNILKRMNDGEDLTFSKGGGWWIGNDTTSGKLVNKLLRHCAISEDSFSSEKYKTYEINDTGKFILQKGFFYINKKLL